MQPVDPPTGADHDRDHDAPGELLTLAWGYVDLKARTTHLEKIKNGDARTVPLSSRAVAVLEALPRSSSMDRRVFTITAQAVKLAWRRATKCAGLEDLYFHDLWHEATSRVAERLPNLIDLAAVTGHKYLRMLGHQIARRWPVVA